MIAWLVFLGVPVSMALGVLAASIYLRFQKREEPALTHARLFFGPGCTLDLVDREGVPVAKVVLTSVTRDRQGTRVYFEDYFRWLQRNTPDRF